MKDKRTSVAATALPFLRWFPISKQTLRADILAGVTVALVLIPQSMAYAQLAGLPAYYGLYAAFLPVIVGALWGSSSQLATGPVAIVSLLTASALVPLAATGSEQFIALAILLALLVGLIQLALGVFRLGALVNLISHPVILGFMSAAALIIGLSQLNKLLGVPMSRSENFLNDIGGVVQQLGDTHLPTLLMGVGALLMMLAIKRFAPKLPGVLIAVAITTLVSWNSGFESKMRAEANRIADPTVRAEAQVYLTGESEIKALEKSLVQQRAALKKARSDQQERSAEAAAMAYQLDLTELKLTDRKKENRKRFQALRRHLFVAETDAQGNTMLALHGPAAGDATQWRINKIDASGVYWVAGGEVVGNIRPGLHGLALPRLDWDSISALLSAALVISLVAFMEAMAAKTRERIDPNRELIGQGLANLTASFSQTFPVSGSFSRSAVNISAGAVTGLSSVFSGVLVLFTLLFLTPLLYHLPQAVLAAVIMLAVMGLINFKAIRHAWQTQRHDGAAAIVTFAATLFFAPHLDMGILFGAGLAITLFLLRQMKPRAVILGRLPDGSLGDIKTHGVAPVSRHFVTLRYDGSLDFMNAAHFEDMVLQARANYPEANTLLVIGNGINSIDASGEEKIREIAQYLRAANVTLAFSSLKKPVRDTFDRAGLTPVVGVRTCSAQGKSHWKLCKPDCRSVKMPLLDMHDMLHHAYRHGYAVGAFGVAGWDILEGVVEAAEQMRAPIILSVSKAYPGTDNIESLARAVIEMGQRATIPVAFQIEVDDDLQAAQAAIGMGCGGIVFNASGHLLPDNVALTKKVTALAAPQGVLVVGQVGQLETEQGNDAEPAASGATSPLEAKYYVERTGVGCLAVSVNRMQNGGSKYDFSRLSKINQAVAIPLGIHGSAGFTDDQMRRMIGFGAAKIHYSSALLDVAARRIRENALAGIESYAATMEGVRDAVRIEVERCIRVWGSGGRAAEVLMQCRPQFAASASSGRDLAEAEDDEAGRGEENIQSIFASARPRRNQA